MSGDVNRLCLHCMQYAITDEGVCAACGTSAKQAPRSPHHLAPRSVLGAKYLAARVLGEGGFGITYLGWDLNLEVKVAIKEYFPLGAVTRNTTVADSVTALGGDTEVMFTQGRERFVDEARRLARFYSLPGIVSVKDFFQENGTAYIVMEFVEGSTLKEYVEGVGGRMPEAQVLALFQPLIKSLAQVHKEGIIHRDIAPDNIMLTPEGALCLIDFGAARDFNNDNKSLSVLLKPGYAPEEQYRSRGKQGPWTDVYALAATMYRCLEGEKPPEAMERLLEDEMHGFTAPVSPQTADAVMKGLAVRQANRWQNFDEMYVALYGGQMQGVAPAPVYAAAPQSAPVQPRQFVAAQPQPVPQQAVPQPVAPVQPQPVAQAQQAVPQTPPAKAGGKKAVAAVLIVAVVLVVLAAVFFVPRLFPAGNGTAGSTANTGAAGAMAAVDLTEQEREVLNKLYDAMEQEDHLETATLLHNEKTLLSSLFADSLKGQPLLYTQNGLRQEIEGHGLVLRNEGQVFFGDYAAGVPQGQNSSVKTVTGKGSIYYYAAVGNWENGKLRGEAETMTGYSKDSDAIAWVFGGSYEGDEELVQGTMPHTLSYYDGREYTFVCEVSDGYMVRTSDWVRDDAQNDYRLESVDGDGVHMWEDWKDELFDNPCKWDPVSGSVIVEVDGLRYAGAYSGDRRNGMPHGNGVWVFDKYVYTGEWADGAPNGDGLLYEAVEEPESSTPGASHFTEKMIKANFTNGVANGPVEYVWTSAENGTVREWHFDVENGRIPGQSLDVTATDGTELTILESTLFAVPPWDTQLKDEWGQPAWPTVDEGMPNDDAAPAGDTPAGDIAQAEPLAGAQLQMISFSGEVDEDGTDHINIGGVAVIFGTRTTGFHYDLLDNMTLTRNGQSVAFTLKPEVTFSDDNEGTHFFLDFEPRITQPGTYVFSFDYGGQHYETSPDTLK